MEKNIVEVVMNNKGEVVEIEPDQEYWRESEEDDSVALQHID